MTVVCVTHYKLQRDASCLNQNLRTFFLNENFYTENVELFGYTSGISTVTMQPRHHLLAIIKELPPLLLNEA